MIRGVVLYGWCMLIGGDSLFGGNFRLRVLTVALVVAVVVCVSLVAPVALAQDPEDATSEPGYTILPGEEGYVEVPETSPDGVEGEAEHECDDDPQAAECPPSPPTNLSLSRRDVRLYLAYTISGWRGSNTHWYRAELQRSASRSGTYTSFGFVWVRRSPALAAASVSRGNWYKLRAQRCRTRSTSDCGDWTSFTAPLEVPRLPTVATGLASKLSGQMLTGTYTASGSSSKDRITIARRLIGLTGSGSSDVRNISGSGYGWSVVEGYEYRFRVRRCTDDARSDCGGWSAWSDWKEVPTLATGLTTKLSDDMMNGTYTVRGSYHDEARVASRLVGSSGSGTTKDDDASDASHSWPVSAGNQYRFQVRRCLDADLDECGRWSVWSRWKSVPTVATGLSQSLSDGELTGTYTASGSSTQDQIKVAHRSIGSSGSGTESEYRVNGTRHVWAGSGGREYRFQIRRCLDSGRSECGVFSSWSSWKSVPHTATGMSLGLSGGELTATFTGVGAYLARIDIDRRLIGTTRPSDYRVVNNGTGYKWTAPDDYQYRFRVKRCLDSGRRECGNWSSWSGWKSVPDGASGLTLALSSGRLTASYSARGSFDDEIKVASRSIGSSSSGTTREEEVERLRYSWDGSGGSEYRFQIRRCLDSDRDECGSWSTWSSWKAVPANASGLSLGLSDGELTATFTGVGSYSEQIDIDRRQIGTTRPSDYLVVNNGSGYKRSPPGGYEYRFRVKRCLDSGRRECGYWSSWSGWQAVPVVASNLSLSRSVRTLTTSFSPTGSSRDVIERANRSIGSTGSGSSSEYNASGSGYRWTGSRGDEYRYRMKRCTDTRRTKCSGWSAWSGWEPVPNLPVIATELSLERAIRTLTTSYKAPGSSKDVIRIARRSIGTTGSGSSSDSHIDGAGHSWSGTRDYEYRFRVKRCTDKDRTDCGDWSGWSDWEPVPVIPEIATELKLERLITTLTTGYNAPGSSKDVIKIASRSIGSTGSGSSSDSNIDGSGHNWSGARQSEYRYRIKRCTDDDRNDCGGWSAWSGWEPIPVLPGKPAKPSLSVSEDDLTVTYKSETGTHPKFNFESSDSEDGTFTEYKGGTLEGAKLSSVATGKWYQVILQLCTDDGLKDCSVESDESEAVEVPEPSRFPTLSKPTLESRADGTSVTVGFTLPTGFDYQLQLQSRLSVKDEYATDGNAKPVAGSTSHAFTGIPENSGRTYRVQLRACVSGSTTDCGLWVASDTTMVSKAPAPTVTGITLSGSNNLTVAYTEPSWDDGTVAGYDFKLRRAESSSGSFRTDYTDGSSPSGMPHKFNGVHTGYYYKVLSRSCSDSALAVCGDWSGVQSGVNVPPLSEARPPTNIRATAVSHVEVSATFGNSSWTGQTAHYYVFELGKSSTRTGTYVFGSSTTDYTSGKVSFVGVETGKWYKVRGKRCHSDLKRCGAWSESSGVQTVAPNPRLTITDYSSSITVGQGLSRRIEVSATGLDATKSYTIRFTTSKGSQSGAILKFANCRTANPPNEVDVSVDPKVKSSGKVARHIYGCAANSDVLWVSLRQGTSSVASLQTYVRVPPVPVPTDLRANGHSPLGIAQIELRWTKAERPERHEYQILLADDDNGVTVDEDDYEWSGVTTLPLNQVIPVVDLKRLYAIRIRTVRSGFKSEWSDTVYGFPTYRLPQHGDSRIGTGLGMDAAPRAANLFLGRFDPNHSLSFTICANTFPEGERQQWVDDIEAGMDSWVGAIEWRDPPGGGSAANIIQIDHAVSRDCELTEPKEDSALSIVTYEANLHRYVAFCGNWIDEDQMAALVPFACVPEFGLPLGRREPIEPWSTHARPTIRFDGNLDSSSKFKEWKPGTAKVRFKREACSNVSLVAAHEVGHAIGVGHTPYDVPQRAVMVNGQIDYCGPQPFDVVAAMAIYQSNE